MPDLEAPPVTGVLQSTPVPSTTTHQDGTTTAGTIRVVHAPGAPVPPRIDHACDPRCPRCTS